MSIYRHKEAFALMWYACKVCGSRERIWNSRDGVTPFGLTCPSCGKTEMYHVDWPLDACTPDHKPHRGQRFFRDGTSDEAEAIMRKRIAASKDRWPVTPAQEAELIRRAREGEAEWQTGWPRVDVAT